MTRNEKIKEEISRHLNTAYPSTRKKVEENPEYIAALKNGDMETALDLAYGMMYGEATTKKRHRYLLDVKKSTDDLTNV